MSNFVILVSMKSKLFELLARHGSTATDLDGFLLLFCILLWVGSEAAKLDLA